MIKSIWGIKNNFAPVMRKNLSEQLTAFMCINKIDLDTFFDVVL